MKLFPCMMFPKMGFIGMRDFEPIFIYLWTFHLREAFKKKVIFSMPFDVWSILHSGPNFNEISQHLAWRQAFVGAKQKILMYGSLK